MSIQPELTNDPMYRKILREALKSKPTPFQSGFYVNAIGITKSGLSILGGNHEYGITSAIHAEESIRANWAEKANHDDLIQILAFASKKEISEMTFPCGNCRDVLKDILSPGGYLIQGSPEGKMMRLPLSVLYSDNPKKLPGNNVTPQLKNMVDAAFDSMNKSYDYSVREENKNLIYGAAISTRSGELFSAGFDGDIAYHPSLPLRNAQILLKNAPGITTQRLSIEKIVVVQKGTPYVPYKDRQSLMEFIQASDSFLGEKSSVPIYMFEVSDNGEIKNRWRTYASDWLRFPFSPKSLGLENELKNSIAKLFK